jgi:hypothetical protein
VLLHVSSSVCYFGLTDKLSSAVLSHYQRTGPLHVWNHTKCNFSWLGATLSSHRAQVDKRNKFWEIHSNRSSPLSSMPFPCRYSQSSSQLVHATENRSLNNQLRNTLCRDCKYRLALLSIVATFLYFLRNKKRKRGAITKYLNSDCNLVRSSIDWH